jgi:hypothetical protein
MFLFRPVREGLCTWADLKNGNVSLCELADFHELLDAEAWAEAKLHQDADRKGR